MKIPSDKKILEFIFKYYSKDFEKYDVDPDIREKKIYVPIDCSLIAEKLKTNGDIVFGRLYYHLEKKYGFKQDDGTRVPFFTLAAGRDVRCVHFPLLVSVLADLQQDSRRFWSAFIVSFISLIVSVVALIVATFIGK